MGARGRGGRGGVDHADVVEEESWHACVRKCISIGEGASRSGEGALVVLLFLAEVAEECVVSS